MRPADLDHTVRCLGEAEAALARLNPSELPPVQRVEFLKLRMRVLELQEDVIRIRVSLDSSHLRGGHRRNCSRFAPTPTRFVAILLHPAAAQLSIVGSLTIGLSAEQSMLLSPDGTNYDTALLVMLIVCLALAGLLVGVL